MTNGPEIPKPGEAPAQPQGFTLEPIAIVKPVNVTPVITETLGAATISSETLAARYRRPDASSMRSPSAIDPNDMSPSMVHFREWIAETRAAAAKRNGEAS